MRDNEEWRDSSDYPEHVQNARFLRLGLDLDPQLWPREPDVYTPSTKFSDRFRRLRGALTLDDLHATIKYGELYPAAKHCSTFCRIIGGVAVYIIVEGELDDEIEPQLKVRPAKEEFPDLSPDNFRYRAVTLWPYILDREEAWASGWPGKVLDIIEDMKEENY